MKFRNPAKILFLVTEDWYFVSHRLQLAIAVKEAGYDVVVATRISHHKEEMEKAGLRVIPLKCMSRSSLNPFRELRALFEIFSIYRKEKPDLVHHVALKPAAYGSLVASLVGVRAQVNALGGLGFVFSSERKLAHFLRPLLIGLFRFLLNGSSKRLILQNQHDANILLENKIVHQGYVRMIRGAGVELNQYQSTPLPGGTPVVMMASRLLVDKGVREFVNAARMLKQKNKGVRCVLVGAPDLANPATITEDELAEWTNEGCIEWWGHQNDMPKVIASSYAFVLPSFYGEGLPKALIEAAACGRAIITTDHPGCRDAIEPNKTGLLIPPRDPEALADVIEKLLDDPALCRNMGRAGRHFAEQTFDVKHVIAQHIEIYNELL